MSPIAHLRGPVQQRGADWVVVDVGGIGFLVQVPAPVLASLGAIGQQVSLHTHLHIGPDGPSLYGFATAEELRLFQMLIGVSGLGPKGALSLLSALAADALAAAIAQGDVERLTQAPGIGRRIAERLVLELRGRLQGYATLPTEGGRSSDEVLAALVALGYSRSEAEAAVRTLPPPGTQATPEERLRQALQQLGHR